MGVLLSSALALRPRISRKSKHRLTWDHLSWPDPCVASEVFHLHSHGSHDSGEVGKKGCGLGERLATVHSLSHCHCGPGPHGAFRVQSLCSQVKKPQEGSFSEADGQANGLGPCLFPNSGKPVGWLWY